MLVGSVVAPGLRGSGSPNESERLSGLEEGVVMVVVHVPRECHGIHIHILHVDGAAFSGVGGETQKVSGQMLISKTPSGEGWDIVELAHGSKLAHAEVSEVVRVMRVLGGGTGTNGCSLLEESSGREVG